MALGRCGCPCAVARRVYYGMSYGYLPHTHKQQFHRRGYHHRCVFDQQHYYRFRPRARTQKQFDKNKIIYNNVADEAVAMTFNRTMFTSLTTLIMVIMLTALGVVSMRHFTLPILFGLLAGTYSSMFLAAPLWAAMQNGILKYRAKQYAKYKAMK